MAWPTVSTGHYDSATKQYINVEERPPTTGEKLVIVATSPLWGPIALVAKANQVIEKRRKKARKAEKRRIAKEKAEQEALAAAAAEEEARYEQYITNVDDIEKRVEALLNMSPSNGVVAVIAKDYETSTSVWHYMVTKKGTLIRRRPWDGASVIFDDFDDMREDFFRYHYKYGFRLES